MLKYMNNKMVLTIFVVLLSFTGCASIPRPTPEQLATAEYGNPPSDYKTITMQHISVFLIDPYSAIFSGWRGPSKGWYKNKKETFFGYRVCVFVNAKNRMGGYTGRKLFFVIIKDNHIIAYKNGNYRKGTMGEQWAYDRCKF